MSTTTASAADLWHEGAGIAVDYDSTEVTQLIQSQLAQWLAHAAADIGVVARQTREDGDEAIVLQVRFICRVPCRLPVLLELAKQPSSCHDAGRCDADEL